MDTDIEIVPLTWDVADDGYDDEEPFESDDEELFASDEEEALAREEERWRRALREARASLCALDHTDLPHSVAAVLDSMLPHEVPLLVGHVADVPLASIAREENITPALARKRWERIPRRDAKIEAMQYIYLQKRLSHTVHRPKRTVAQESVAATCAAEEVTRDDPQPQEAIKLIEELRYWQVRVKQAQNALMPAPLTTIRPQYRAYWEEQLTTANTRVTRLRRRLHKMLGTTPD
jgi:hypothetical protein